MSRPSSSTHPVRRSSANSTGRSLSVLSPEPTAGALNSSHGNGSPRRRQIDSAEKAKKHKGTVLGAPRKMDTAHRHESCGGAAKQDQAPKGGLLVLAPEVVNKRNQNAPAGKCCDEDRGVQLQTGDRRAKVNFESTPHGQDQFGASFLEKENMDTVDLSTHRRQETGAIGYLRYLQRQANAKHQADLNSSESDNTDSDSESECEASEGQPRKQAAGYRKLDGQDSDSDHNGGSEKNRCSGPDESQRSGETGGAETNESESESEDEDGDEDDDDDEEGKEKRHKRVDLVDPNTITEESVLASCGIQLPEVLSWQPTDDHHAPLELVAEFLRCVMEDKLRAALILCEKVILMEPDNCTAQEFYPTIMQRLQQEYQRTNESSSEEDETDDDSESSEDDDNDEESEEEEALLQAKDNTHSSGRKHHTACHHSTSQSLH